IRVVPLAEWMAGAQVRHILWVLLGAVFCVLLVTCTNVANLMLARGVARSREFALRAALGAGRGRLVRQLLTESILISCAGGLLGIFLAAAGLKALLALAPANLPRLDEVHVDPVVLGFATLLSIFTGLLFGLFPARSASRRDPQEVLRGGGRTGSARSSASLPLVAGQCSIALVLLTGAGLLARSFLELQNVKPGFEPRHLLTFTLDLPGEMAEQKAQGIVEQTVTAIDRLPGVQSAAVGGIFQDHIPNGVITVEGRPPEESQPFLGWGVSPGYFQTMRMPLLRGRVFETTERSGTVVSESFARRFWPGQDPLGKRFKISLPGLDEGNWSTVIGVVGDRPS
ncbi:MAG TPA: FtsX-like permease family protein, partial [Bryobacteraceae bacterium]|nr:FtsX-like permease family protein [Bryobacteraceae bacterium]